ncbi:kinetochore Sim4 complex subunit FTA2-domain-containing protein [Xylaria grammica]|nr:kinetochore Sim4 complex subunit FTA2-domain-containing protein [Xylaria grammica]
MSPPLPRSITGPKLKAFEGDIESVQFKKLLGPDDDEQSHSQIPHSRVFRVTIEGKTFALKIFNFFSLEEIRPDAFGKEHLLKDNVVRHQLDPFYAECRAFGLLVEKKRDDELAVRCHGYVFLSETLERRLERDFGIRDWNRKAEDEGSQLRAIVKDYIQWRSLRHRKTFEVMRKKLEELNKLGIYNMDIREANYLGGRLFDFSIAITFPHLSLWPKLWSVEQILNEKENDLACFDSMVKRVRKKEESERVILPPTEKQQSRPVTRSQKSKALSAGI